MTPVLRALRENASRWNLPSAYDPDRESSVCRDLGVEVLTPEGGCFPDLLRSIPDPPLALYLRGGPLAGDALGIVGSRRPTPYGRRMARELAAGCARAGIVVVSGLARGIDGEAHRAALEAGGRTWAVIGSGLDRMYPPEHEELAESIVSSGGAVLSEVPLGGEPLASNFPRRNRILSGLCWGTVVVEGDIKSGSLVTARLALEQGREVFAVPGPADSPLSFGPHELLRQGARLARGIEDILEDLPMLGPRAPGRPAWSVAPEPGPGGNTLEQKKILELLGRHALGLEELAAATGWEVPRLLRALSELEAGGLIAPLPGQRYGRI